MAKKKPRGKLQIVAEAHNSSEAFRICLGFSGLSGHEGANVEERPLWDDF